MSEPTAEQVIAELKATNDGLATWLLMREDYGVLLGENRDLRATIRRMKRDAKRLRGEVDEMRTVAAHWVDLAPDDAEQYRVAGRIVLDVLSPSEATP